MAVFADVADRLRDMERGKTIMAASSPWIIDASTATFESEIIERSKDVPVVVDFWAPWCGPCRQLGPVLEQLANESDGKFILAKVDIDQNPELAQAFGVQSIPFVVAVRDKKIVNQFVGMLPEPQLREWLGTVLPTPAQERLAEGATLEASDPTAAEAKYREAVALEPSNTDAKIHLARLCLAQGREEESRGLIHELEQRGFLEPEAERIRAQLDLQSAAEEAGGLDEARRAAEAAPDDWSLQLKLADALAVTRHHEEALDICLQIIQKDRAGVGVEAKQTMVKIFDLLGPESEIASTYRRKLATVLY